ncbi:MAG: HD domain-containing protein [Ruminococcus sp.]|nr:HD domain-containing protein [Ruminococcus sp.]
MELLTDKERILDLENEVEKLNKKVEKLHKQMDALIFGIGTIVESRDMSTGHHVFRTSRCVSVFVDKLLELNFPDIDIKIAKNIVKAAPLHDIGKIAVTDSILKKNGRFTPEEFEKMKAHAEAGGRMAYMVLSDIPDERFVLIATNIALYHHERWDGDGYPKGLSGTEIPLEARIMALADVFDALVSKRCYKESLSFDDAFFIIRRSIGTHFDPELGEIFLSCRPQLEELYTELFNE